ncbi:unnamed protein product [Brachionus calyciflorus]|uniref:Uncharacterized protein n=1 Tax=Brachionus calyciflorus TaxID=104777 RepID=A0A813PYA4_9BILA|nr:unnamed protein product [Brachionus calyciflorus]
MLNYKKNHHEPIDLNLSSTSHSVVYNENNNFSQDELNHGDSMTNGGHNLNSLNKILDVNEYIQKLISKLEITQVRINKLNEIKSRNFSVYQEQIALVNNEQFLKEFSLLFKSKCIKLEINIKAFEKKKLNLQIELLNLLKLKLMNDSKNGNSDHTLISDEIYSFLDNYFEPDFFQKKDSCVPLNQNLESIISLPKEDRSHGLNINQNNNNNNSNFINSDTSISQARSGVFKNEYTDSSTKALSVLTLAQNEELPTRFILRNIRIKIFRIFFFIIMKIVDFFTPPVKPTKEDKIFYIKKILFTLLLIGVIYYVFAFMDPFGQISMKSRKQAKKPNPKIQSLFSILDEMWITLSSMSI